MNFEPFDEVFDEITKNKQIAAEGGFIGIPFPFAKLNSWMSGIQEGDIHLITAGTGVSKSKYTRFVYIYNVYKFYLRTKYRVQLFYFPLEDSRNKIVQHLIVYRLFDKYGINSDISEIMSKKGEISDELYAKIGECRAYFGQLFEILHIYPETTSPAGIMHIGTTWAGRLGEIKKDTYGNIVGYNRKITNIHTIFIIDNLSNISEDRDHNSKHAAIGDLTSEKVRKVFSKLFNFTTILVAQQDLASDRQQYSQNGKSILEKLMPNINSLATNKECARDCHIAFGIFAPHRYEIKHWPAKDAGYNIETLQDNFRQLSVIKNNEGPSDFRLPLWFEGGVEFYEEMPGWSNESAMAKLYRKANELREIKEQKELQLFK